MSKEFSGLDVGRLLKSTSLSKSTRENLERADRDGDGIIDVEELMTVLENERSLRRERKLLVRILVAVGVACILTIAAVAGLTYAVVHMSKEISVDGNVLASKDGLQPLSTASLQETHPLKGSYKAANMSQLAGITHVTVPFGDGMSMFTIENIHLVPGKSVRFDTSSQNVSIMVTADGVSVAGDEEASTGRRRLTSEDDSTATGTVRNSMVPNDPNKYINSNNQTMVSCGQHWCVADYSRQDFEPCVRDKECISEACHGSSVSWNGMNDIKGNCKSSKPVVAGGMCLNHYDCGYDTYLRCKADAADWWMYHGSRPNAKGTCVPSADYYKKVGEPCEDDAQCQSGGCSRPTAADGEKRVCCKDFAGYAFTNYCKDMPLGSTCWSDAQCEPSNPLSASKPTSPEEDVAMKDLRDASRYCQGNCGGLCKGKCTTTSKKNGELCTKDRECASNACGRLSADPTHPLLCCADGLSTYAGYDYCKNLPVGAMCWSDAMCLTGYCKGNLSGLQRGLCSMG